MVLSVQFCCNYQGLGCITFAEWRITVKKWFSNSAFGKMVSESTEFSSKAVLEKQENREITIT